MTLERRYRMATDEVEGHAPRYALPPSMQRELKTPRRSFVSFVGKACLIVLAVSAYLAFAFIVAVLMTSGKARSEEAKFHSNPWLLSWIPATCCVTNDCCWEVSNKELTPRPHDSWTVNATGQVLPRTGWSPDGKYYRCACDLTEGKWVRHQGANTRCVFVVLNAF